MTTAVRNDRLKQRFQMWDVDKNGRIERSDYDAEARRIVKAFGETPDSPKGRAVLDAYLHMYDFMANKTGTGDRGVTEDQFISFVENEMFKQGDAGFGRVLRPTVRAIVDLCDTDGDGEINPAEFKQWLKAIGLDQSQADEAFRKLDTDRSGKLTVDELVHAVKEFHYGNSDAPLLGGR